MTRYLATPLATALILSGCATTSGPQIDTISAASSPAYAVSSSQSEMIVAVSPARQTFQIAGLTTGIIGAGISAITDAKHRRAVEEVLDGYDAGALFKEHLQQRLADAIGPDLTEVAPLGSTAGYKQKQEAELDRYRALARKGHEILLDLDMTYGLFGYQGTLVAKLQGELNELPRGSALWRNTYVVTSEPVLALDKLSDPTKRVMANYTSPRLTVQEGAIEKWTVDGGATLRQRYEEAVHGVVAALLTDLGLADEVEGHYYLGQHHMNQKNFDTAAQHYKRALEIDPAYVPAMNALAVNHYHAGELDQAVLLTREILASNPEYAAAHLNMAWWYTTEYDDPDTARPHYEQALALGLWPEPKIEKALD